MRFKVVVITIREVIIAISAALIIVTIAKESFVTKGLFAFINLLTVILPFLLRSFHSITK